jgi:hypothetical protein
MTIGRASVSYTIERLKNDLAVLPPHYIGVQTNGASCKVIYDASKFPLYMTLGGSGDHRTIILWNVATQMTYDFRRE